MEEDYTMALSDFTGELMRYAISLIGKGDKTASTEISKVLQNINRQLKYLASSGFAFSQNKLEAVCQNLKKVEESLCTVNLFQLEYPTLVE